MDKNQETKKCPYCAEEIKAEAIKCKHCGSDLENSVPPQSVAGVEKQTQPQRASKKETTIVFSVFALILVVLFIIYVLPAYRDYIARSESSEGIQLAGGAEVGLSEFYQNNQRWPYSLSSVYTTAGMPAPVGRYVTVVEGGGAADDSTYGVVGVMKDSGVEKAIAGQGVEVWTTDGGDTWHCGPAFINPLGFKYLPASCRDSDAPAFAAADSDKTPTSDGNNASSIQFAIGESFGNKTLNFTITSVEIVTRFGNMYSQQKASQGGEYILVQWNYENLTDKPIAAEDIPSLILTDANGNEYDSNPTLDDWYKRNLGISNVLTGHEQISPKITVSNASVFEVSTSLFDKHTWVLALKGTGASIGLEGAGKGQ